MATQWRAGLFRMWIVLTILWCLGVMVMVYKSAADGASAARNLAWVTAQNDCVAEPSDKQSQCVTDRARALEIKYDATTEGYLSRIVSDRSFQLGVLFIVAVPPLVALLIARIIGWVLRGFRAT